MLIEKGKWLQNFVLGIYSGQKHALSENDSPAEIMHWLLLRP